MISFDALYGNEWVKIQPNPTGNCWEKIKVQIESKIRSVSISEWINELKNSWIQTRMWLVWFKTEKVCFGSKFASDQSLLQIKVEKNMELIWTNSRRQFLRVTKKVQKTSSLPFLSSNLRGCFGHEFGTPACVKSVEMYMQSFMKFRFQEVERFVKDRHGKRISCSHSLSRQFSSLEKSAVHGNSFGTKFSIEKSYLLHNLPTVYGWYFRVDIIFGWRLYLVNLIGSKRPLDMSD